jgi:hypothetical protein
VRTRLPFVVTTLGLAADVRVDLSDVNIGHKDPCEAAAQVAGMMMKTMREAA